MQPLCTGRDQLVINRWCIANSKSSCFTTLRGGTRLVYCEKLDIHPSLTIAPLSNLMKKLQKVPSDLDAYDKIIQTQMKQRNVERVSNETQGERECYVPHKAVIREAIQSTKMFIVFDTLVKAKQDGLSLNNSLETGSPLATVSNQLPCVETLLSRPSSSCGLEKQIVTCFDFIG